VQSSVCAARVGCVRYLNSRPLIFGHQAEVFLDHPSRLADALHAGELDAALVPVYEIFLHPGYWLVDGCGIVARGPVYSVFIAHHGPLESIRELALDPASLSSAHLAQILLAETVSHPVRVRPLRTGERPAPGVGLLLIGDQASAARAEWGAVFCYHDLAEAWLQHTGLPFVFAVWAVRNGYHAAGWLADTLRGWMRKGVGCLDAVIASEPEERREFARVYLTRHIFFDVGPQEKAGLMRYGDKLYAHGLIPSAPVVLEWI